MKRIDNRYVGVWLCILFVPLIIISACGSPATAPVPGPTLTTTAIPTTTATPTATATPTPEFDAQAFAEEIGTVGSAIPVQDMATRVSEVATAVAQRTPIPSPTPGVVDRVIVDIVEQSGLAESTFLGLTAEDWLDLAASALIILLALLLVIPALIRVLTWLAQRTPTRYDDELLEAIRGQLFWLAAIVIIEFAILRLDFLGDWFPDFVKDVAYLSIMFLLAIIGLRSVEFTSNWLLEYLPRERGTSRRFGPLIMSIKWLMFLLVLLIVLTLVAAHFGFNITLLVPSVLFLFLIVGILGAAAQSALTDSISGILILTDEPFRIGDIIYLPKLDTTGEVTSIGLRTTRIRSGDNRWIVVPNREIGESEVVNYSHPDPRHRTQIDFIAVGGSFDQLQQLIERTVSGIEGVLTDRSVDVIYLSFGGTGREIRVRWWIGSLSDQFRVQTSVLVALENALDAAGIETPNLAYDLHLNQIESPPDGLENSQPTPDTE